MERFCRENVKYLKSMDPVEGRNIATKAMLPLWKGFTDGNASTSMTAWEAVTAVEDLAYCMTQTEVSEENGQNRRNVPTSYSFNEVGHLLY